MAEIIEVKSTTRYKSEVFAEFFKNEKGQELQWRIERLTEEIRDGFAGISNPKVRYFCSTNLAFENGMTTSITVEIAANSLDEAFTKSHEVVEKAAEQVISQIRQQMLLAGGQPGSSPHIAGFGERKRH